MKKLLQRLLGALWNDEAAARSLIRGTLHTFGVGGAVFADQLAAVVNAPGLTKAIRIAGLVAIFLGGNLVVGQTNPEPPAQAQP